MKLANYALIAAVSAISCQISAQQIWQGNAGFGSGKHFVTTEQDGEQIISVIEKEGVTYRYVRIAAQVAVVRRCIKDRPDEELARFGESEPLYFGGIDHTCLVDIEQQGPDIAILLLTHSHYYYLRLTQHYQTLEPPPGDAYMPDQPEFIKLPWKPLAYGAVIPDGIDTLDFMDDLGRKLGGIDLIGVDQIRFDFTPQHGQDTYVISGKEVTRNQAAHSQLTWCRVTQLESAWFAYFDSLSDQQLHGLFLPKEAHQGPIDADFSRLLDSLHDSAKARALRTRIESLF